MDAARELLRRAERPNGSADRRRRAAHLRAGQARDHGASSPSTALVADEFIVSHGAQTAVGHDMGSGPIAPGEPIVHRPLPARPRVRLLRRHDPHVRRRRASGRGRASTTARARRRSTARWPRSSRASRARTSSQIVCERLRASTGYPTQLLEAAGRGARGRLLPRRSATASASRCTRRRRSGARPSELVAGDVVTVEPGLYRHGYGGCRLEDSSSSPRDGGENLTRLSRTTSTP